MRLTRTITTGSIAVALLAGIRVAQRGGKIDERDVKETEEFLQLRISFCQPHEQNRPLALHVLLQITYNRPRGAGILDRRWRLGLETSANEQPDQVGAR